MNELMRLDAVGQAHLVRSRQVSAQEMVMAGIDAVEKLDPHIGAVRARRFEQALAEAGAVPTTAPFAGVPLVVKSIEPMAGAPADMGSMFAHRIGRTFKADSEVVRRLRRAGFVPIGQSTTPEFALASVSESKLDGVTCNPWNPRHTPGGSSGGAAAAVSAGMVAVASGTDGGGSIRMPASFCGLLGLKSSYGRFPVGESGNDQWNHSVPGILTRTVRDTAAVTRILASGSMPTGNPDRESDLYEPARLRDSLRIGVVHDVPDHVSALHPDVRDAVASTVAALEHLGHHVDESHPDALFDSRLLPMFFDSLSVTVCQLLDQLALEAGRAPEPDELDPVTWHWERRGREIDGIALADALTWQRSYRARMARWWERYDVLVSPVFATPAPEVGWIWREPDGIQRSVDVLAFTVPANTTGQPSIAVPRGLSREGLPVGVQLTGRVGDDNLLLAVAQQLGELLGWDGLAPSATTTDR